MTKTPSISSAPLIVSVVRDTEMYNLCIANNQYCNGCEKYKFDNAKTNHFITVLYNQLLNKFDYSSARWIIFCHEDFRPYENLKSLLDKCNPNYLYGPIGGIIVRKHRWRLGGEWISIAKGCVTESNKDGTEPHLVGNPVPCGTKVETFDCQCLIVHSSLICKFGLRFDESLSFDFYVEDFCIAAYQQHKIHSLILPIKCQHYSKGNIQPRFFTQLEYLYNKYPYYEAYGSSGYGIGGGRTLMRRIQKNIRRFLDLHFTLIVKFYFKIIK